MSQRRRSYLYEKTDSGTPYRQESSNSGDSSETLPASSSSSRPSKRTWQIEESPAGSKQRASPCRSSSGGHDHATGADGNNQMEGPTPVEAGTTLAQGGLGPGAEPPVAVAYCAFAYESKDADSVSGDAQQDRGASKGLNDGNAAISVSPADNGGAKSYRSDEERGEAREGVEGLECMHDDRCAQEQGEFPGSCSPANKSEEAETVPDYFNLSDDVGPEGAPTGRGTDEKGFVAAHRDQGFRSTKKGFRGCFGGSRDSHHSSESDVISEREVRNRSHRGLDDDREPCNDSSGATSESFSSPPRCHSGRDARRRPFALGRNGKGKARNQVAVSGFDADFDTENSSPRRRHGRSKRRAFGSPPRRGISTPIDNGHGRRRSASKQRQSRRARQVLTDAGSATVGKNRSDEARVERELARLRLENSMLKQRQQHFSRFKGSDYEDLLEILDDRPTAQDSSSPSSNRRRRSTSAHCGRRSKTKEAKSALAQHVQLERGRFLRGKGRGYTRNDPYNLDDCTDDFLSRDAGNGRPRSISTKSWSEFVSNARCHLGQLTLQSPPPEAREQHASGSGNEAVDLNLPSILVEGGFLWKIPYHNSGTPKRRWFQMKPADGVLTTASGRLLVRPGVGDACARADEGINGDCDSVCHMQLTRIRAAWPLGFIWMDPERDLERSPPREIGIEEIVDVARGHKTPAFWQQAVHRGVHTLPAPELCFSLIGNERTLDLAAESASDARRWAAALSGVALRIKQGQLSSRTLCRSGTLEPRSPGLTSLAHKNESAEANLHRYLLSKPAKVPIEGLQPGEMWMGTSRAENRGGVTETELLESQDPTVGTPLRSGRYHAVSDDDTDSVARPKSKTPGKSSIQEGMWTSETLNAWRKRLFPAVVKGDADAVNAFFEQGCPVDLVEPGTGDTALMLACRMGDIGIARECLRRGSKNDPHPTFGQTALQAAVAAGKEGCTQLLLETAAPSMSDTIIANHKDPNRETPLHVASRHGFVGIVEALLHHGADARLPDKQGSTALHAAAAGGHEKALAFLLDAADDALLEERNRRGNRPLHLAAAAGHMACVQLLLETAAEADVPNTDGKTPFALASVGGHLAVTRLIRQYAPDAGTPAGGGTQAQPTARGMDDGEGSRRAMPDALPRPHSSARSGQGSGTPERPSRDRYDGENSVRTAEDNEECGALAEERELTKLRYAQSGDFSGRQWATTSSQRSTSSAQGATPLHGSLFDGLSVYVVGGRQPLGPQQTSTPGVAGISTLPTSNACASSRMHHSNSNTIRHYPYLPSANYGSTTSSAYLDQYISSSSSPLAAASSGTHSLGQSGCFLRPPSTVAPSPPGPTSARSDESQGRFGMSLTYSTTTPDQLSSSTPAGTIPGTVYRTVPGMGAGKMPMSARALARMIHFSQNAGKGAASGGSAISGEAVRRGEALENSQSLGVNDEGVGTWMKAEEQKVTADSQIHIQNNSNEDRDSVQHATSHAGTSRGDDVDSRDHQVPVRMAGTSVVEKQCPEKEEGDQSFILEEHDGNEALSGHWYVGYSQGYPYYLHQATGHSQWEDPRSSAKPPRKSRDATPFTRDGDDTGAGTMTEEFSNTRSEAPGRSSADANHGQALLSKDIAGDGNQRAGEQKRQFPVSPIKPVGISIAVEVPRFDETTPCKSDGGAMEKGPDDEMVFDGDPHRALCSEEDQPREKANNSYVRREVCSGRNGHSALDAENDSQADNSQDSPQDGTPVLYFRDMSSGDSTVTIAPVEDASRSSDRNSSRQLLRTKAETDREVDRDNHDLNGRVPDATGIGSTRHWRRPIVENDDREARYSARNDGTSDGAPGKEGGGSVSSQTWANSDKQRDRGSEINDQASIEEEQGQQWWEALDNRQDCQSCFAGPLANGVEEECGSAVSEAEDGKR